MLSNLSCSLNLGILGLCKSRFPIVKFNNTIYTTFTRAALQDSIPTCTSTPGKWNETRFLDLTQFSANKSELEIRIDDGEYHNELSKAAKALNIFNGTFKINNMGKLEIGNKIIDNGKSMSTDLPNLHGKSLVSHQGNYPPSFLTTPLSQ